MKVLEEYGKPKILGHAWQAYFCEKFLFSIVISFSILILKFLFKIDNGIVDQQV
jgi:hypothetical protein